MLSIIGHLVNKVMKYNIYNEIPISSVSANGPASMQQSTYNETRKVSSSELMNSVSKAKVVLAEASYLLDLSENYVKCPSERTAKPLKLFLKKAAHNELFTPDENEFFLDMLRSLSIDKCSVDDKESFISANRDLDNDVDLHSQPNSILEETSQVHSVNEKSSFLAPNLGGNQKNFESDQSSNLKNLGNVPEDFENILIKQVSDKIPTQEKDFVSSDEDSSFSPLCYKDKRNKKPEREISKDSRMVYSVIPQLNKGERDRRIHAYPKYSGKERELKSEKMIEENALKSRNSIQFPKPPAQMILLKVKDLEQENLSLKSQMKLLETEYKDILAELGQIAVEKNAKENEDKKSELFQQIFRPALSEATTMPSSNDRPINNMNVSGCLNRFLKPQTMHQKDDVPSVTYPSTSRQQPAKEADTLVQRSNHQPRKEEMVTSDIDLSKTQKGDQRKTKVSNFSNNNENQTPPTQNSSTNTSRKKARGGKEINQSENVQGPSGLASTPQQSFFGTECVSLGNVPPTSVATTLYNNYKLLLLSLGQRLLSGDVVKLKNWASQNFAINNPQNATDILLQLDQKGVVNASNLSQLCNFFESIVRIDLVCIIDAFVLGDFSLLRLTLAPKKQAANPGQIPTSQSSTNPMYQSVFNPLNTSQSLVNQAARDTLQTTRGRNPAPSRKPGKCNGAKRSLPEQTQLAACRNSSDTHTPTHFPRSLNKNLSTASEQQNLQPATGFAARLSDEVASDGSVTSMCFLSF
ncbi:---NA--- [Paramuricea clavata]|uniref:---NA n=1 Tax=Paramuricea clavata TaxID=317549 RepID=A0A6S7IIC7_PARCT|nr:---NA--- [Paramuricea clavata]